MTYPVLCKSQGGGHLTVEEDPLSSPSWAIPLNSKGAGETSVVGAVVRAVLIRRCVAHPAILGCRAVVGAPTVAGTLLFDVVITAERV